MINHGDYFDLYDMLVNANQGNKKNAWHEDIYQIILRDFKYLNPTPLNELIERKKLIKTCDNTHVKLKRSIDISNLFINWDSRKYPNPFKHSDYIGKTCYDDVFIIKDVDIKVVSYTESFIKKNKKLIMEEMGEFIFSYSNFDKEFRFCIENPNYEREYNQRKEILKDINRQEQNLSYENKNIEKRNVAIKEENYKIMFEFSENNRTLYELVRFSIKNHCTVDEAINHFSDKLIYAKNKIDAQINILNEFSKNKNT